MTTDRRDCRSCKWARRTTPYGTRLGFGMYRCAHPVTREPRPLVWRDVPLDEERRPPPLEKLTAREVMGVRGEFGEPKHPLFRWPWAFSPELLYECRGHEEPLQVGKEAEVYP